MKLSESESHLTGKSIYTDDIPEIQGTLYGKAVPAETAHAENLKIDINQALKIPGAVRVIRAEDVPGENQIGAIIQDEPLLADGEIHHIGQPVAFVLAETQTAASKMVKAVKQSYNPLPVVTDARTAAKSGSYIHPPRTFAQGDLEYGKSRSKYFSKGQVRIAGQEHLYLETQRAYTLPQEDGNFKIHSSTQSPTAVQAITAKVLGIAMHKIEVDVRRLGGAFGGKEDQATHWACLTAIGAMLTDKPVKYILSREEDLLMTGKRHPYDADFKIGLDEDLKISYYEADFFQNAGSAADLSPAISERTLFHAVSSYFVPNTSYTVHSCKTNLPPNTAFRGFGAPQAIFVIEAAIEKIAEEININPNTIKNVNLLTEGDSFPYGQKAEQSEARNAWESADKLFDFEAIKQEVKDFNQTHELKKQGYSITPLCFGISFTNTSMNHARALVHIYHDGSIGISTAAIEMGQGVNTKMKQIAAEIFSISPGKIKLETTNTTRVANTSPTAASSGSDLNGKALEKACINLRKRLLDVAYELTADNSDSIPENITLLDEVVYKGGVPTEVKWEQLIEETFLRRISLSENAHYATPKIHFNKKIEKGRPFSYHVYGNAITVAEIDSLRGTYDIKSVKIVHDFGKSMNPQIDRGQVEGALMQGIGWVTMEELAFNDEGKLLSNALSSYKVPDIYSAPHEVSIEHLKTEGHEAAIKRSKAVGEPPFMYGIGSYFAIRHAAKAFNPNIKGHFKSPMTPERLLTELYRK
ncbi:MAG: molybdopterin cofactor-binding domain-containing protein [Bacteroidota bacterium]|nr:molybdopterin cofactor-binding domain-containing protein [Bacteroidota bacterium]